MKHIIAVMAILMLVLVGCGRTGTDVTVRPPAQPYEQPNPSVEITPPMQEAAELLKYSIKGCINKVEGIERVLKTRTDEQVKITAQGDTITFSHSVNHLCNLNLTLEQEIKGKDIILTEKFTGEGARCQCDSEVSANIGPLRDGTYTLKVFKDWEGHQEQPELITEQQIPIVGQEEQTAAECNNDNACVPASCCHAKSCTTANKGPDCSTIMCTMNCEPGTLDCGQGQCVCAQGTCMAKMNEGEI